MPYVFMVFWAEGRVYNEWKNTHKQMKTKPHKTHSCCGKVSCPSLPPAPFYQSHQMPISISLCETWTGQLRIVRSHSTSGADRSEGLLEAQASGPINNHTAELWVRQQSADEPVSTKQSPFPLPFLQRTTLTFKQTAGLAVPIVSGFYKWCTSRSDFG